MVAFTVLLLVVTAHMFQTPITVKGNAGTVAALVILMALLSGVLKHGSRIPVAVGKAMRVPPLCSQA